MSSMGSATSFLDQAAKGKKHYVLKNNNFREPFPDNLKKIWFGAGCFWGTEKGFWRLPGVFSTAVGYCGGDTDVPTYKQVCSGLTNHTEVTQVVFDPNLVSVSDLLKRFWECHDPTQGMRQGGDVGSQYRSAIYTEDPEHMVLAKASKQAYGAILKAGGMGEITTEIAVQKTFYYAELYHQQYLAKPKARQYCSAEPTGLQLPVYSSWSLPAPFHREFHQPRLPQAFWRIYDGSIRAKNGQEYWTEQRAELLLAKQKASEAKFAANRKKMEKENDVLVVYCGSCGYGARAEHLGNLLKGKVGVRVGLLQEVKTTGNFDVFVKNRNSGLLNLIHSKKANANDGFVDNFEKFERILRALSLVPLDEGSKAEVPEDTAARKKQKDEPKKEPGSEEIDIDSFVKEHKIVMFSKTYCGFCKKAKRALIENGFVKVQIVELDTRKDGENILKRLYQKTGSKTVPSIWMKSEYIGGSDVLLEGLNSGKISLRNM